jgi:hypothetical protein
MKIADQQDFLQIQSIFKFQMNIVALCIGLVICQFLIFYLHRNKQN